MTAPVRLASPVPAVRLSRCVVKKTFKCSKMLWKRQVTKQFAPETLQRSLLFRIEYPEIEDGCIPRHRFMSSFEQKARFFLFLKLLNVLDLLTPLTALNAPHLLGARRSLSQMRHTQSSEAHGSALI